ncbi:MAG: ATP-binding protein [Dongiaceae bacterium]
MSKKTAAATPADPPPTAATVPEADGLSFMLLAEDQRIGRIVSVSGSQAVVLMEESADNRAVIPAGLMMGTIVKIPLPETVVYGLVCGLSVPIPATEPGTPEMKIMEIELIGESVRSADGSLSPFRRGVSMSPPLASAVFTTSQSDLRLVYLRPGMATARIGSLHQERRIPALIGVDDLLGKHFAVVGATGSGKSCSVTVILRAILDHHPNAHIVMLDPHNEYAHAIGDRAEVIGSDSLQLPYWLFNFEEICEVLAQAGAKLDLAESALFGEYIANAKRQFLGAAADGRFITADTPSPYRITLVTQYIDETMGRLEKPESLGPYHRLKAAINLITTDSRFSFMFGTGIAVRDNMASILSRILRLPVDGKPVTILDLSAVPSEILNAVVSVLCRLMFDFSVWSDGAVPILLVCEEAHRYAPEDDSAGFGPTKRSLSRIAKEGRKYGLSLCVATQRPAELAAGMLSQCNTIFTMRLSHQRDQELVRAALSDAAIGLLEALPTLGNAEAIAVGQGIAVPMRMIFTELPPEQRPKSASATFSAAWKNDIANGEDFVQEVVDRWRRVRR